MSLDSINSKPSIFRHPKSFSAERLREEAHIGVVFCDSLGDFLVVLPLLSTIKEQYPRARLDYFGGPRTASAEKACSLIDDRCDAFGNILSLSSVFDFIERRRNEVGPYDLTINLDDALIASIIAAATRPEFSVGRLSTLDGRGILSTPTAGVDGLNQEKWSKPHLMEEYGNYLASRHISHILCAISHFPYPHSVQPFPLEDLPTQMVVPEIIVSLISSNSNKMWPVVHWITLVEELLRRGHSVGIIGTSPDSAARYYDSWLAEQQLLRGYPLVDMRGLTVTQQGTALSGARVCVSIDNGVMHLSCDVGTQTIALFGPSPWQLWAPQSPQLSLLLPPTACLACDADSNSESSHQQEHTCMESIAPEQVLAALAQLPYGTGRGSS